MPSRRDGSSESAVPDGGRRRGAANRRSPDGPSIDAVSERAMAFAREHLVLAWVPLATALFAVDDLLATGGRGGIGVRFSFPLYRADLWTFVERPATAERGLDLAAPFVSELSALLALPVLAAYLVVSGALTAGLFGSVAEGLETGSFDFVANLRRYVWRMALLELVVLVGFTLLILPLARAPGLLLVALLVLLGVAYYVYPTAYVLVLEDRPVLESFERAVELVKREQPIEFVLQVALASGACSLLLSVLARSSVPGAITAAALAAPVGLAFNAAVMLQVRSMLGRGPPAPAAGGPPSGTGSSSSGRARR